MNHNFFLKLAAGNMKRNGRTYIPYMLSCSMTVAVYYIVKSLSMNPGLKHMRGGDLLSYMLFLCSYLVGAFALIFLFYTNSFLMKRRKKEFGIFHILGMKKSHIARTLAWETLYTALVGITGGLVAGIALDKAMFLLAACVIRAKAPLGFFLSGKVVLTTVLLFAAVFFLIFVNSVRQIQMTNATMLLKADNVGEKEPKTKRIMALLGTLCVGAGYYLAQTTKNQVALFTIFFVAAALVILGTYLLFAAGSIALLKALRKNKKYYYKTKHFISISGMIYRMKQNAAGLANICILSTAVLIMVSSTSALMLDIEGIRRTRYPNDFSIYARGSGAQSLEGFDKVRGLLGQMNQKAAQEMQYSYLALPVLHDNGAFLVRHPALNIEACSLAVLVFVTLDEYNAAMGTGRTLQKDEVLIYSNREAFDNPVLKIFDKEYQIKEKLNRFMGNGNIMSIIINAYFVVLPDGDERQELYEKQREALAGDASEIQYYYGFDVDVDEAGQMEIYGAILNWYAENGYPATVESRAAEGRDFDVIYGGFFFLGIFLGSLCIMATALIIYYKQISEGFDDRERFEMMRRVGMSDAEVRGAIRSQVLTMFFLPPAAAGIHVAAASPMIGRMLLMLNFLNLKFYIICMAACFFVFLAAYFCIYLLTAGTYYKIVTGKPATPLSPDGI